MILILNKENFIIYIDKKNIRSAIENVKFFYSFGS